jgi:hypothetical protein
MEDPPQRILLTDLVRSIRSAAALLPSKIAAAIIEVENNETSK